MQEGDPGPDHAWEWTCSHRAPVFMISNLISYTILDFVSPKFHHFQLHEHFYVKIGTILLHFGVFYEHF